MRLRVNMPEGGVPADGHALRHAAKLGLINPRRAVRRRYQLRKALQFGLGVVLSRGLVAGSVGRYKTRWPC
jgi:hypothetical protein